CSMADLFLPHGGLTEPVNCQVPQAEQADFKTRAASWKKVPVSDADLSSLYRMGDGGLSPLTGPMDGKTWNRVLDEEILTHDGKPFAWTIPIAFPVEKGLAGTLKSGETVALVNSKNELVGSLQISDIYAWDKPRYIKSVYNTERTDHPGGRMTLEDQRD